MNYAHAHLILNHIPPILFPSLTVLLAYAIVVRDNGIKRVTFGAIALVALLTIPVYLTGLKSDELLGHVSGYNDPAIDAHKDWAFRSLVVAELAGAFCLILLAARWRRALPGWSIAVALLLSLIVTGLMAWTAYIGGHIRHPESYPNWKPPAEEHEDEEDRGSIEHYRVFLIARNP